MNQVNAVKCNVVGRVETVENDRQFIFEHDGTALPFSIGGQDINPPWPVEMEINQQWSVIPKIDSQGQIISLKGWKYQKIDCKSVAEEWCFTGQIQQISKRHGRVFFITEFRYPKPQKTVLTFLTDEIEKFSPNELWQITASRQGNILVITDSKNLTNEPEKINPSKAPIIRSIAAQRRSLFSLILKPS
jgi:hypothetical protein